MLVLVLVEAAINAATAADSYLPKKRRTSMPASRNDGSNAATSERGDENSTITNAGRREDSSSFDPKLHSCFPVSFVWLWGDG